MRLIRKSLQAIICLVLIDGTSIAQWMHADVPHGIVVNELAVGSFGRFFAGTRGNGVFLSTNNGTTWTAVDSGLTNTDVTCLTVSGTNVFAGTMGGGVFCSANNGTSWTSVDSGLTNLNVSCLVPSGKTLLAGTYWNGVFLSTNDGASWTHDNDADLMLSWEECFAVSGTKVFAGVFDGGVWESGDNGVTWRWLFPGPTPYAAPSIWCIAVNGTNIFTGGYLFPISTNGNEGITMSSDNGINWYVSDSGLTSTNVTSLVVSGTNVFAGTNGGGVFLSANNGASWMAVDSGLTDSSVTCLAASGTTLLAGTSGGGVWCRPLSEMVTNIKDRSSLPTHSLLQQNYPNPFNPTTTISYDLPSAGHVTLKVFDALGRRVETLVNERELAGIHVVRFSGNSLPSGVYFYELQDGTSRQVNKMLLLK